jgi:hypothetical protein
MKEDAYMNERKNHSLLDVCAAKEKKSVSMFRLF